MDRKIKTVWIVDRPRLMSENGEIVSFWKEMEQHGFDEEKGYKKRELWYKQNNREINGKYVIEIEWEG